jgi:DNA primase
MFSEYLETRLDNFRLRSEYEASADCPLCGKGKEHFYIHVGHEIDYKGRDRHGRWICFSCSESGDGWRLIGHIEGMSPVAARIWWLKERKEAAPPPLSRLARRIRALRVRGTSDAAAVETALPYGFVRVKRRLPRYLAARGVALETARTYNLGWCESGDYRGRIVFPIVCPLGRSWTARATWSDPTPKYWAGDGAGRLLFGWDVAFASGVPRELVVVEGPMDVIGLYQAGIPAVAVMSKHINPARAMLLRRSGAELVIMLDADAWGASVELSEGLGRKRVALLAEGDPGDAGAAALIEAHRDAVPYISAVIISNRARVRALLGRFDRRTELVRSS